MAYNSSNFNLPDNPSSHRIQQILDQNLALIRKIEFLHLNSRTIEALEFKKILCYNLEYLSGVYRARTRLVNSRFYRKNLYRQQVGLHSYHKMDRRNPNTIDHPNQAIQSTNLESGNYPSNLPINYPQTSQCYLRTTCPLSKHLPIQQISHSQIQSVSRSPAQTVSHLHNYPTAPDENAFRNSGKIPTNLNPLNSDRMMLDANNSFQNDYKLELIGGNCTKHETHHHGSFSERFPMKMTHEASTSTTKQCFEAPVRDEHVELNPKIVKPKTKEQTMNANDFIKFESQATSNQSTFPETNQQILTLFEDFDCTALDVGPSNDQELLNTLSKDDYQEMQRTIPINPVAYLNFPNEDTKSSTTCNPPDQSYISNEYKNYSQNQYQVPENTNQQATCSSCTYYPQDKHQQVDSYQSTTYTPSSQPNVYQQPVYPMTSYESQTKYHSQCPHDSNAFKHSMDNCSSNYQQPNYSVNNYHQVNYHQQNFHQSNYQQTNHNLNKELDNFQPNVSQPNQQPNYYPF